MLNIVLLCVLVLVIWLGTFRIVRLVLSIRSLNVEIARRLYVEWLAGEYRPRWMRVVQEITRDGHKYRFSYDTWALDGVYPDLKLPIFNRDGSVAPQDFEGFVDDLRLVRCYSPASGHKIETLSVIPILSEDLLLITTPTGPPIGNLDDFKDNPGGWV